MHVRAHVSVPACTYARVSQCVCAHVCTSVSACPRCCKDLHILISSSSQLFNLAQSQTTPAFVAPCTCYAASPIRTPLTHQQKPVSCKLSPAQISCRIADEQRIQENARLQEICAAGVITIISWMRCSAVIGPAGALCASAVDSKYGKQHCQQPHKLLQRLLSGPGSPSRTRDSCPALSV